MRPGTTDHAAGASSLPVLRPRGPAGALARHPRARTAIAAAVLLLGVVVVRSEVAGPVRVSSQSMAPSLQAGDVVLVGRGEVSVDRLRHGDLVTFTSPADGRETLKRVVALPGETVAVLDAVLHVDGRPVAEPYVDRREWDGMWTALLTVPAGSVYVLGDDRLRSVDSRDYGPVPEDALDGRVLGRLWPLGAPLTTDAPTSHDGPFTDVSHPPHTLVRNGTPTT